ncbi:hypothetical protein IL54_1707 [Sphingobium sp. ba1]|nr:hypothetical protein IL54_1707 [Sphingobium sp. ba1]
MPHTYARVWKAMTAGVKRCV